MIIAIEGMDGAGKTTICNHIERRFNFINIEKPTKYLFEDEDGKINYDEYYKCLKKMYKYDNKIKSVFFGDGNYLAVSKYPGSNIVLDRHIASNYYWNGEFKLHHYFADLIRKCGKPDLTIFLYATPHTRYNRLKKRNEKDIDLTDSGVFDDGTNKHLYFFNKFGFNYQIIFTDEKSIGEVCRDVDKLILKMLYSKEAGEKEYVYKL